MKSIFIACFLFMAIASVNKVSASLVVPTKDSVAYKEEKARTDFKNAVAEYKSLSRHEKKLRIREAKNSLKAYKADKKAGKTSSGSDNDLLLIILAILLPPLAVYLHQGEINTKFWISLLLTLLFILPGIIYAILVVTGNA